LKSRLGNISLIVCALVPLTWFYIFCRFRVLRATFNPTSIPNSKTCFLNLGGRIAFTADSYISKLDLERFIMAARSTVF